jgi:hypothetical protein
MNKIGRNDPCPCGSGMKFKKCHMGREEELVIQGLEGLPRGTAEKITALPEVSYGRCRTFLDQLNMVKLTQTDIGIKFIDLKSYLALDFAPRSTSCDLNRISAGQMVNPIKTHEADPDHIYIAVSPAVSDSTLIHQLAHALDYLAGSRINPGLAQPLSLELELPSELIEHPREFGEWLDFLRNELGVVLDAEDTIVSFLHEHGRLLPGEVIAGGNQEELHAQAKGALDFIRRHRQEIDERIRDCEGYLSNRDVNMP